MQHQQLKPNYNIIYTFNSTNISNNILYSYDEVPSLGESSFFHFNFNLYVIIYLFIFPINVIIQLLQYNR